MSYVRRLIERGTIPLLNEGALILHIRQIVERAGEQIPREIPKTIAEMKKLMCGGWGVRDPYYIQCDSIGRDFWSAVVRAEKYRVALTPEVIRQILDNYGIPKSGNPGAGISVYTERDRQTIDMRKLKYQITSVFREQDRKHFRLLENTLSMDVVTTYGLEGNGYLLRFTNGI